MLLPKFVSFGDYSLYLTLIIVIATPTGSTLTIFAEKKQDIKLSAEATDNYSVICRFYTINDIT
jgi:hypothetical protein